MFVGLARNANQNSCEQGGQYYLVRCDFRVVLKVSSSYYKVEARFRLSAAGFDEQPSILRMVGFRMEM